VLQHAEPNTTGSISTILRSLDLEVLQATQRPKRFAGAADDRLHTARRVFSLIPLVVFLLTLSLFAGQAEQSAGSFMHVLLRAVAVSLASSIVCIAAYGFYFYLQDKSHGL
jgi:hypothetical protein